MQFDLTRTKNHAKLLTARLTELGIVISHGQSLEGIAAMEGHRDWNTFVSAAASGKLVQAPPQATAVESKRLDGLFIIGPSGEGKTYALLGLLNSRLQRGTPTMMFSYGAQCGSALKQLGGTHVNLGAGDTAPTVTRHEGFALDLLTVYSVERDYGQVPASARLPFPTLTQTSGHQFIMFDEPGPIFKIYPALREVIESLIKGGAKVCAAGHSMADFSAFEPTAENVQVRKLNVVVDSPVIAAFKAALPRLQFQSGDDMAAKKQSIDGFHLGGGLVALFEYRLREKCMAQLPTEVRVKFETNTAPQKHDTLSVFSKTLLAELYLKGWLETKWSKWTGPDTKTDARLWTGSPTDERWELAPEAAVWGIVANVYDYNCLVILRLPEALQIGLPPKTKFNIVVKGPHFKRNP